MIATRSPNRPSRAHRVASAEKTTRVPDRETRTAPNQPASQGDHPKTNDPLTIPTAKTDSAAATQDRVARSTVMPGRFTLRGS